MTRDMNQSFAWSKRQAARVAEFVWPSRSIVSGQRGLGDGAVPPQDWAKLVFIGGVICRRCGRPETIDLGDDTVCAACEARPPKWSHARAALVYNEASRRPVLDLKRSGQRDGLKTLGRWMVQAGGPLVEAADCLVPVPLHYRRLVARGHNQSAWLAAEIGRQTTTPVIQDAIRRTKPTPSQAGLNARARRRNMSGAFDIRRSRAPRIAGKRVVLIDDVLTTGATVSACTAALKRAGAANVDVLVLARVVREIDVTM